LPFPLTLCNGQRQNERGSTVQLT